jgi:hypothetical protein
MKFWLLRMAGFAAAFVFLTAPALAHHARSGYDLSKTVTFKATVTKVDWVNPHALIYFDVTDSSGRTQNWHKEGTNEIWLDRITLPNGREVVMHR